MTTSITIHVYPSTQKNRRRDSACSIDLLKDVTSASNVIGCLEVAMQCQVLCTTSFVYYKFCVLQLATFSFSSEEWWGGGGGGRLAFIAQLAKYASISHSSPKSRNGFYHCHHPPTYILCFAYE